MPEYEYRCRDCDQLMSIERSMTASADELACVNCGSSQLARIWGASFVSANAKNAKSSSGMQSQMCVSNPSQPKSCCPCSG